MEYMHALFRKDRDNQLDYWGDRDPDFWSS